MSLTLEKPLRLSRLSVPLWFFAFVPFKFGEAIFITLLPLFIVQTVNGSVTDVGRVHALISLAGVLAFIVWGNLSDKWGRRRPFLMLGFLGFGICTCLSAIAPNISQVPIFTTIGAFLMAAITPVSSALILNGTPEDRVAISFGRFYQISGWSFVGGVLFSVFWLAFIPPLFGTAVAMRSLLLFAGAVSFLSFILCCFWVREPRQIPQKRQYQPQLTGQLSGGIIERRAIFYPSRMLYFVLHPSWQFNFLKQLASPLLLYYGCAAVFFFAVNVVFVPFPIFLTDILAATNTQVLLITLGKAAIESFFYLPMGRFVQKRRGLRLQALATAVRIAVFMTFATVAIMPVNGISLWVIGLTHLLTGLTWAAISISSSTMVAALAEKGQEGMAMGVYNSLIGVSTIIGSLVGGMVAATFGYTACFAIGAVLMGLVALWLLWLESVMPNQRQSTE